VGRQTPCPFGRCELSEKRILLNLDLFAESIDVKSDLDTVREILSREKKGGKDEGLQLQGTLRIRTKSLSYDRIAWMPFDAEVMFDPHGVEVVVREANLCGISTPGSVKIANENFSLDLRPFSKGQELQSAFRCLLDQEMRVKGILTSREGSLHRGSRKISSFPQRECRTSVEGWTFLLFEGPDEDSGVCQFYRNLQRKTP